WFQAQQFCRAAGKRLLTNAEWQSAAAGTPDGAPCVVNASDVGPTGTAGCKSNAGAFDMVGDLYEWVGGWSPPATGWSTGLFGTNEENCMTIDPTATPSGPAALFRGGSFFFGTSAGVFAVNGSVQASGAFFDIGFRCGR